MADIALTGTIQVYSPPGDPVMDLSMVLDGASSATTDIFGTIFNPSEDLIFITSDVAWQKGYEGHLIESDVDNTSSLDIGVIEELSHSISVVSSVEANLSGSTNGIDGTAFVITSISSPDLEIGQPEILEGSCNAIADCTSIITLGISETISSSTSINSNDSTSILTLGIDTALSSSCAIESDATSIIYIGNSEILIGVSFNSSDSTGSMELELLMTGSADSTSLGVAILSTDLVDLVGSADSTSIVASTFVGTGISGTAAVISSDSTAVLSPGGLEPLTAKIDVFSNDATTVVMHLTVGIVGSLDVTSSVDSTGFIYVGQPIIFTGSADSTSVVVTDGIILGVTELLATTTVSTSDATSELTIGWSENLYGTSSIDSTAIVGELDVITGGPVALDSTGTIITSTVVSNMSVGVIELVSSTSNVSSDSTASMISLINIAFERGECSADSVYNGGDIRFTCEKAHDNNAGSTRWLSDTGAPHWWRMEWDTTAVITYIQFNAAKAVAGEHFNEYYIDYWDGDSWVPEIHVTGFAEESPTRTTHDFDITTTGIQIRTIGQYDRHGIYEFRVLGVDGEPFVDLSGRVDTFSSDTTSSIDVGFSGSSDSTSLVTTDGLILGVSELLATSVISTTDATSELTLGIPMGFTGSADSTSIIVADLLGGITEILGGAGITTSSTAGGLGFWLDLSINVSITSDATGEILFGYVETFSGSSITASDSTAVLTLGEDVSLAHTIDTSSGEYESYHDNTRWTPTTGTWDSGNQEWDQVGFNIDLDELGTWVEGYRPTAVRFSFTPFSLNPITLYAGATTLFSSPMAMPDTHYVLADFGASDISRITFSGIITSVQDIEFFIPGEAETFVTSDTTGVLYIGDSETLIGTSVVNSDSTATLFTGTTEFIGSATAITSDTTADLIIGVVELLGSSITITSDTTAEVTLGDIVELSGTVKVVSIEFGSIYAINIGSENSSTARSNPSDSSLITLDETHVCLTYPNWYDDGDGYGFVAEIDGTDITFGTPTEFRNNRSIYIASTPLDSTSVFVVYQDDDQNWGMCVVGTTSGNTISYPNWWLNPYQFEGTAPTWMDVTALDSTTVCIVYRQSGADADGISQVGVLDLDNPGSEIAWGGVQTVDNGDIYYTQIEKIDSTHICVTYVDIDDSFKGVCKIGTISGSSISWGSENTFRQTGNSFEQIQTTMIDSTSICVAYRDSSGSPALGKVVIGTISGNTVTFGSTYTFGTTNMYRFGLTVLENPHVMISFIEYSGGGASGWKLTSISGEISNGDEITWDESVPTVSGSAPADINLTPLDSTHALLSYGGAVSGQESTKMRVLEYVGTQDATSQVLVDLDVGNDELLGASIISTSDTTSVLIVESTSYILTGSSSITSEADATIATGVTELIASSAIAISDSTADLDIGNAVILSGSISVDSTSLAYLDTGLEEILGSAIAVTSDTTAALLIGAVELLATSTIITSDTTAALIFGVAEDLTGTSLVDSTSISLLTIGEESVLSGTSICDSTAYAIITIGMVELLATSTIITSDTTSSISIGYTESLSGTCSVDSTAISEITMGVIELVASNVIVSSTDSTAELGIVGNVLWLDASCVIDTTSISVLDLGASEDLVGFAGVVSDSTAVFSGSIILDATSTSITYISPQLLDSYNTDTTGPLFIFVAHVDIYSEVHDSDLTVGASEIIWGTSDSTSIVVAELFIGKLTELDGLSDSTSVVEGLLIQDTPIELSGSADSTASIIADLYRIPRAHALTGTVGIVSTIPDTDVYIGAPTALDSTAIISSEADGLMILGEITELTSTSIVTSADATSEITVGFLKGASTVQSDVNSPFIYLGRAESLSATATCIPSSSTTGMLVNAVPLTANFDIYSEVHDSDLKVLRVIEGSSDSTSNVVVDLTLGIITPLEGSVGVVSDTTSTMEFGAIIPLSGTVNAVSNVWSYLVFGDYEIISGTSTIDSTVGIAELNIDFVELTGITDSTSDVIAELNVPANLSSDTIITSDATATISVLTGISGAVDSTSVVDGLLLVAEAKLSGSSDSTSFVEASIAVNTLNLTGSTVSITSEVDAWITMGDWWEQLDAHCGISSYVRMVDMLLGAGTAFDSTAIIISSVDSDLTIGANEPLSSTSYIDSTAYVTTLDFIGSPQVLEGTASVLSDSTTELSFGVITDLSGQSLIYTTIGPPLTLGIVEELSSLNWVHIRTYIPPADLELGQPEDATASIIITSDATAELTIGIVEELSSSVDITTIDDTAELELGIIEELTSTSDSTLVVTPSELTCTIYMTGTSTIITDETSEATLGILTDVSGTSTTESVIDSTTGLHILVHTQISGSADSTSIVDATTVIFTGAPEILEGTASVICATIDAEMESPKVLSAFIDVTSVISLTNIDIDINGQYTRRFTLDLQYWFSEHIIDSTVNKFHIPHPPQNICDDKSFVEMLFNDNYAETSYRHLYRQEEDRSRWPSFALQRMMIQPAQAKYFVADSDDTSVCTINLYNLQADDLTMMDKLLTYRIDSTSASIADVDYEALNTNLSKMIHIYLNLMINGDYSKYDNEELLAGSMDLLESCFETYLIDNIFIYVSNQGT